MAAILSARADEEAKAHLSKVDVEGIVTPRHGDAAVWYVAAMRCPHPADPSMWIRRSCSSHSREGALELVRLELRGALARYFADPAAGRQHLNVQREGFVYRPSELGIQRVMRAMVARGHAAPKYPAIGGAYLECAGSGGGDVTVGDVVEKLCQREAAYGQIRMVP